MSDLVAHIDGKQDEMLALLEHLVNVDSATQNKTGVDRLGSVLAARLADLGFAVERVPQMIYGDHVVGRKHGKGGERILLLGHMDTAFPVGTAEIRPFRVEQGRAYGPGVADMKGGIVCLLYALEALRATGHPAYDALDAIVVFNSDEEALSPTSRPLIEREARQAHAVCVFERARAGGEYVVARKGVGRYRLTVWGRAAHAGTGRDSGCSAIEEMAHKIIAIHRLTDGGAGITINVGTVQGGERFNIVAEKAAAEFDLRIPSLVEATRLDARLREIATMCTVPGTRGELSGGLIFPPMEETAATRQLLALIQAAGRQLRLDLRGTVTGGGSDGNYASQFAPTLDGMGPQGDGTHSEREFVEIATLPERAKVAALFLASWPETCRTL